MPVRVIKDKDGIRDPLRVGTDPHATSSIQSELLGSILCTRVPCDDLGR